MLGEQAFFEPLTGRMRASVAKDLLDSALPGSPTERRPCGSVYISFDANNTDFVLCRLGLQLAPLVSWIWLGSDTANRSENIQASAAVFVVLPIIGHTTARTIQQLLRDIDVAREHGKLVVPIVYGTHQDEFATFWDEDDFLSSGTPLRAVSYDSASSQNAEGSDAVKRALKSLPPNLLAKPVVIPDASHVKQRIVEELLPHIADLDNLKIHQHEENQKHDEQEAELQVWCSPQMQTCEQCVY